MNLPLEVSVSYNYEDERRKMVIVTNLRPPQLDDLLAKWLCKTHSLSVQSFCKFVELQDDGFVCKPSVNPVLNSEN